MHGTSNIEWNHCQYISYFWGIIPLLEICSLHLRCEYWEKRENTIFNNSPCTDPRWSGHIWSSNWLVNVFHSPILVAMCLFLKRGWNIKNNTKENRIVTWLWTLTLCTDRLSDTIYFKFQIVICNKHEVYNKIWDQLSCQIFTYIHRWYSCSCPNGRCLTVLDITKHIFKLVFSSLVCAFR
jgi:hypothetical protein